MKNRVLALIDGFNYYHKIEKYQKKYKKSVKWLDYRKLITSFLREDDDIINAKVVYYSALACFTGKDPVKKHLTFISALQYLNIEVVLGNFKAKKIRKCITKEKCKECSVCQTGYLHRYEEKESDVNIAIKLIEDTILNRYDKCFLLTGDSDFVSVVKRAKELRSDKRIIIVPPPPPTDAIHINPSEYKAQSLAKASKNNTLLINFKTIEQCQLPDNFHDLQNPWTIQENN